MAGWISLGIVLLLIIAIIAYYRHFKDNKKVKSILFSLLVLLVGIFVILISLKLNLKPKTSWQEIVYSILNTSGSTLISIGALSIIFELLFVNDLTKSIEHKLQENFRSLLNEQFEALKTWFNQYYIAELLLNLDRNKKMEITESLLSSIEDQQEWKCFVKNRLESLKSTLEEHPFILIEPTYKFYIKSEEDKIVKEFTKEKTIVLLRDITIKELLEKVYSHKLSLECAGDDCKIEEISLKRKLPNDTYEVLIPSHINAADIFEIEPIEVDTTSGYEKGLRFTVRNKEFLGERLRKGDTIKLIVKEKRITCKRSTKILYRISHVSKGLRVEAKTNINGKIIDGTAYGNNISQTKGNWHKDKSSDGTCIDIHVYDWLLPGSGFVLILIDR